MKIFPKKMKYYAGLGLASLLVLSGLFSFVPTQPVSADHHPASGRWVNRETISYNGQTFINDTIVNGKYRYTSTTRAPFSCNSEFDFIEFESNPTKAGATSNVGFYDDAIGARHNTTCEIDDNLRVSLSDAHLSTLTAAQAQCYGTRPDGIDGCLERAAQALCQGSGTADSIEQCIEEQSAPSGDGLVFANPPNEDGGGDAIVEPELDCGTAWTDLSWYLCPVLKLINVTLRGLDNAVTSLLYVEQEKIFDRNSPTGKGYYEAWSTFRTIALGLLVIGALIMIIGQALGFDFLDAYTVKKVVPRLIVAIIGIALSWELMRFMVILTNDLGVGVRNLIYAPFQNLNGGDISLDGTTILLTLLTLGPALVLGLGWLLLAAASALLGLLVAFMVLVLRQIVIVVLVLMAPIAIAAYILPNTQGLWKIWNESFEKAMIMFPIIMAFLAVGRVMAVVSTGPDSTAVGQIVGLIAYIIPYFLIPLTFRFAGGALRTLGGFVNDRSKGAFDGLRNKRNAIRKDRVERAKGNQLFDKTTRRGRFGNNVAGWMTDPGGNLAHSSRNTRIPYLAKKGQSIDSYLRAKGVEQSGKLFEELNKSGYNDRAYRVLTGSHGQLSAGVQAELGRANLLGKVPQSLQELQTVSDILAKSDNANERIAASAIAGTQGRLATLYQDGDMGKASIQSAGILGLAAHGFADGDDLKHVGNQLQGKNGENKGFAQSIVSQAQVMGARSRPDVKAGYGIVYKDGEFHNGMTVEGPDNRRHGLLKTLNSQDLAGAKGGAWDVLEPEITATLKAGGPEADAVKDQLMQWVSSYSSASVDIKSKAINYIQHPPEELAAMNLEAERLRRRAAESDPATRGGGGPGADAAEPPPVPGK